jgi:uncharacterized membrane protein YfcA
MAGRSRRLKGETLTDKLMALIAFAMLASFVGILITYVPSPDLIAVVVLTVILVAYDFFTSTTGKNGKNGGA